MRLTKLNKLSGEIERLGSPRQLYKKLYEYEEAEEQGVLVRLDENTDFKEIIRLFASLFYTSQVKREDYRNYFRPLILSGIGSYRGSGFAYVDLIDHWIIQNINENENLSAELYQEIKLQLDMLSAEAEALQALKERE